MSRKPIHIDEEYSFKMAVILKKISILAKNPVPMAIINKLLLDEKVHYIHEFRITLIEGDHPYLIGTPTPDSKGNINIKYKWNTLYEPTPIVAQKIMVGIYENKLNRRKKYNAKKALKEHLIGNEVDAFNEILRLIRKHQVNIDDEFTSIKAQLNIITQLLFSIQNSGSHIKKSSRLKRFISFFK